MTNEELNIALYQRAFEEQQAFRDWLLHQPAECILRHSYEYNMREDILLVMEYNSFSDKQCDALLKSESPLLAGLVDEIEGRETDHMETVRDVISCHANAIIRADFIEELKKKKDNEG